jgi:carotenoid cleavage dioxygenase
MTDTVNVTNPYLTGNYAPVTEETTAVDLEVSGRLPDALEGLLLRDGPNPYGPVDAANHHWFRGDGMVHGLRIAGGRAAWYRNRWVRTPDLAARGPFTAPPPSPIDATIGGSGAVNVLAHAGRILACGEVGLPYELTPELDTVGQCDFGGTIGTNFTAHPKVDPVTGELLAFGYDFGPTHLRYHRIGADGRTVQTEVIDTPGPTMMHDFGVTATRVVFMDLPVVLDLELFGTSMPFRWEPSYGARLGVMPRDGGNADVRWIEIPPCYVFHPLNAHDDGDRIVMDVVRHETMFASSTIGPREPTPPTLDRWVIDPIAGTVTETRLDDRPQEFPRIDERLTGRAHRYGYAVELAGGDAFDTAGIVKQDVVSGTSQVHDVGTGRLASEAVFVPASPDAAEDEGWLLAPVYDRATDRSDVVVIDAQDVTGPPVATVHLPVRIPFGFHGSWVPQP